MMEEPGFFGSRAFYVLSRNVFFVGYAQHLFRRFVVISNMLTSSLISLLMMFSAPDTARMGNLNLTVTNIKNESGRIWVGIYRSDADFLDRERARLVEAKVDSTNTLTIPITDLDYGTEYALAIFHDEDDNGELDRNFFGLPAEPWAFSGEPKTRLRLPRFSEVKFCFKPGGEEQSVRLRLW